MQSRDLYLMNKYDTSLNIGLLKHEAIDLLSKVIAAGAHNIFNAVDVIDLNDLKDQVEECIEYCVVLKRFRKLHSLFGDKLRIVRPRFQKMGNAPPMPSKEDDHFEIDGHAFHTLDEVESAWNNRVFL